ncbi:MAG TPA: 4-hydroxy-tetrahydrodipicolinate synthase [Candidatus Acidoferrales bacterium]|nr:4-hydroxy-tetrahydrodipicolinate synthase [Candidatus Acidoferrales bacterium]
MKFQGVYCAMVTPFTTQDEINVDGMRSNIEYLQKAGVAGLVPCGSTGESATLTFDEHKKLIGITVDAARVPVVAGTGSNSTSEAVELTRYAQDVGADAALLIVPYYNKPMKSGLVKHFGAIADACEIPLVLYNIPGRTGINMDAETISAIAHEYSNVAGVKEASANFNQISEIIELTQDLDFCVISGDDGLTLPMMALGATGVISVAADLFPEKMGQLTQFCLDGNYAKAREVHYHLAPLFKALFLETNPIPVKKACDLLGLAGGPLRLPLTSMAEPNVAKLKSTLATYTE